MFIFRCKDSTVKKCVSATMARKNSVKGAVSPRQSPVRSGCAASASASPTGSGHYAGCKWTEPPLPSALPPPPQHWMQAPHTHSLPLPFRQPQPKPEQHDIDAQLKVLLKVQA